MYSFLLWQGQTAARHIHVQTYINILSLKQYKFYYLYDIISADADIIKI